MLTNLKQVEWADLGLNCFICHLTNYFIMVPFTFSHESSVQGLLLSKYILNICQKNKAIIPIILQKEHLNSHKNAFSLKKFIHFEVSFDSETYETKKILGLFVVEKKFKSTAVFFGDSLSYYSEHTTPTH